MIERIRSNEEKLDKIDSAVRALKNALTNFEETFDDINELNQYYGSKEWFEDKECFESGKIEKVKAGVLSEDAVWNLDEEIAEVMERMKKININSKSRD